MSIEKDAQFIQLSCDSEGCKRVTKTFKKHQFSDMIEIAKSDGWKIMRFGKKWKHYCSRFHTP